jgi:glutamine synthetase
MPASTFQELDRFLADHPQINSFDLLLPDINGMLRGVRATRDEMPRIFEEGTYMSASTMLLDSRGVLPEGLAIGLKDGDPDYACMPVAGTLAPMPWTPRPMGQCLLQMIDDTGAPYHYDSRYVLQRVLERFRELKLTPVVALELEFYLLDNKDPLAPAPRTAHIAGTSLVQKAAQLHSLDELHELDAFLADVEAACRAQGVPMGKIMSEGSPGQCEINLHHVADAENACDHALLLRRLVRAVALRHGMAATFMAKPFTDLDGSGMHIHLSLLDADGRNVFAGKPTAEQPDAYAPALRHAIGGLLATLTETRALLAPNANSYRRLGPSSFVSAAPTWGRNHRQVAIRIPPSDHANVRLEYRPAGADCNPYLVLAAVLAGALHGLTQGIEPPPMVGEGQVIEHDGATALYWEGALAQFKSARVLPDYLGAAFCDTYTRCRELEAAEYRAQVPDLDYSWYLGNI